MKPIVKWVGIPLVVLILIVVSLPFLINVDQFRPTLQSDGCLRSLKYFKMKEANSLQYQFRGWSRETADALGAAKRQAELASVAKSRFLASASHDLRQPLQTLGLLQGLLAKTVEGERVQKLVARLDETLGAISGMLNTLLDINRSRPALSAPKWSVSRSTICLTG